jgi:tRNA threonylcarbamoyladenosine biosynthesis protein TsaB
MMLAIETATAVCAAAVVNDRRVLAEASLHEKYIHAEKLMMQVDDVLKRSEVTLDRLDGIAVSIGPGSFTGLRIGLSVAKGLAFACGKPLIPVSTLRALAQRSIDGGISSEGASILAALDARRDEVYCQWFKAIAGNAVACSGEGAMSVQSVIEEGPGGDVVVTGDAVRKLIQPGRGTAITRWIAAPDDVARCSAGVVGKLGEEAMAAGETADVRRLEPRYVKDFFLRQPL